MFKMKSSMPIEESTLEPDEIEFIKSMGFRRFVLNGKAFWIEPGPRTIVTKPLANKSFYKGDKNQNIREIDVMSLPISSYTVTDIDKKRRPPIPPKTIGIVKTERGWQFIQRGVRSDTKNDKEYVRISKERKFWNQRTKNRESDEKRVLVIKSSEAKKEDTKNIIEAWELAGGTVRIEKIRSWKGYRHKNNT